MAVKPFAIQTHSFWSNCLLHTRTSAQIHIDVAVNTTIFQLKRRDCGTNFLCNLHYVAVSHSHPMHLYHYHSTLSLIPYPLSLILYPIRSIVFGSNKLMGKLTNSQTHQLTFEQDDTNNMVS